MNKTLVQQSTPLDRWIYLFLFLATIAVYSQVRAFTFLDLDDMTTVAANPWVGGGFSWSGIVCDLGNALVEVGKLDDAIRELNTAKGLDPKMAGAYYGLGRVFVAQGRLGDAIPYFSETLRLDPGYTQAREALDIVRKRL